jgi:hypothetical protein
MAVLGGTTLPLITAHYRSFPPGYVCAVSNRFCTSGQFTTFHQAVT